MKHKSPPDKLPKVAAPTKYAKSKYARDELTFLAVRGQKCA
jgi:hypothetical protein